MMNEEQKNKLAKARSKVSKKSSTIRLGIFDDNDMSEIREKVEQAHTDITEALEVAKETANKEMATQYKELRDSLGELSKSLKEGIPMTNVQEIKDAIDKINFKPVIENKFDVPKPTVIKADDVLAEYKPADSDEDDNEAYYGFVSKKGKWYILRIMGDKTVNYRYASGIGDFTQAWRQRKAQNYMRFDEVTL